MEWQKQSLSRDKETRTVCRAVEQHSLPIDAWSEHGATDIFGAHNAAKMRETLVSRSRSVSDAGDTHT